MSSRLKGELVHPNKRGSIRELMFSPDGKHMLAGDYPGGVIALWDVASGKLLTSIETGYGYRSTDKYFSIAPDWQTVYVSRYTRKHEKVERGGKQMTRWTFEGDVHAWNLNDGRLIRTYKHKPLRGIWWMNLSPNGTTFLTAENISGIFKTGYESTTSLWDVKSGAYRNVDGLRSFGSFTPDSRSLVFVVEDKEGNAQALKRIDVATGQEKWSIPIQDKNAWARPGVFSRDGRLLFGTVRVLDRPKAWDWRSWMKWRDAETGREVASFESDKNDIFTSFCCSPDGNRLAVLNWRGDKRKLLLYSIAEKRLLQTTMLCERTEGQQPISSGLTFSPDGKWIAVITRSYPEKSSGDDLDPRDLPQPRIHLIEAATGEIRETMIAPQAFASEACFSPDGRTLATDGNGRVLLWDMTKMPALTSR